MLYLVVEEKYRSYPWCQRALQGLWEEVRKKRVPIQELSECSQIRSAGDRSAVLLLGASEEWVHSQICLAHFSGAHPIVMSNRMPVSRDTPFSSVTMDIQDSIRQSVDYLRGLGCKSLALYGCNPHATSDPWREEVFRALVGDHASVFYNRESLEKTFSEFWQEHRKFDGVICANDYAALSLVRHLQERCLRLPEDLYIVGCGDLFLSRISTPSITSISDDYEHFGRAALSIYAMISREDTFSTVTIQLHSQLHPRMTTGNLPYSPGKSKYPEIPSCRNPFFGDTEISQMVRLETLLNQCDATDTELIRCLLGGKSYASMADICFISETAAKYRIKKMQEICGVGSREQLAAFLKQFFQAV